MFSHCSHLMWCSLDLSPFPVVKSTPGPNWPKGPLIQDQLNPGKKENKEKPFFFNFFCLIFFFLFFFFCVIFYCFLSLIFLFIFSLFKIIFSISTSHCTSTKTLHWLVWPNFTSTYFLKLLKNLNFKISKNIDVED